MTTLLSIEIRDEHDLVLARQRARQVAAIFGFDPRDQTRIATVVSEVVRNAFRHAGGGRVEFAAGGEGSRSLEVVVRDDGPGIVDVAAVLDGRSGDGRGLIGARRVMDRFEIESTPGRGTTVRVGKELPRRAPAPSHEAVVRLADELARRPAAGPLEEVQRQNQELIQALADLRAQQAEAEALNRELEARNAELRRHREDLAILNRELIETNRGVVALHAELDERAISLQRASELKTRFLSNMSHEFRTPLNSIRSLAQFLLDPADGPLPPEKAKQALFIRKAAEGLTGLVDDLLDMAKVEAGKLAVHPETFEVADLFGTLRGTFRPLLDPASPVALVFDEPDGVPALTTDPEKVAQVLRNFIANALKFTERGEVRVSAALAPGDLVVFSVADTGIGVAEGDRARIFEDYGQVDGPIQRRVKGTGLGLPLSRNLAALLGGSVALASEPGVGSTFSATIPRVYRGDGGPGPEAATATPGVADGTLLVIDDDEIARYVLKGNLAGMTAMAVVEASDGFEGLRLAAETRPRAVFLDLNMGGLDGFAVLDRLKADPATREIPVIINSARALGVAEWARLAPASAFLPKGGADIEGARVALRRAMVQVGLASEALGEMASHA